MSSPQTAARTLSKSRSGSFSNKSRNATANGSHASHPTNNDTSPTTAVVVATQNIDCDPQLMTEEFVGGFSPRSKEACKQLGVLPAELAVRTMDSFHERGVSTEIIKLRYQDYDQLRQDTIQMVRQQRTDLIEAGWTPTADNSASSSWPVSASTKKKPKARTLDVPLSQRSNTLLATTNAPEGSMSLVELEQMRLEKMLRRQHKELETMMAYEVKLAEMREKQDQKLSLRKERENAAKEQRKLERYKLAEKRRLWELQKSEEEKKEHQKRDQRMRELWEQEKTFRDQQKKIDEQKKQEAAKKQAERDKKKRMLEARTREILDSQFQQLEDKNVEMEKRDAERKAQLEAQKEALAEQHLAKTRAARQRVQAVLDEKDRLLEAKRIALSSKMDAQQKRMQTFEELKQERAIQKAKLIQAKEEQRAKLSEAARSIQQERVTDILSKQAEHDEQKEELDRRRSDEIFFKQEVMRLNRLRKEKNVERLRRIEDYKRQTLLEKVEEDIKRIEDLEEAKNSILLERQRNKINATRQKTELLQMFEQLKMKKSWSALAQKTLTGSGSGSDSPHGSETGSEPAPTDVVSLLRKSASRPGLSTSAKRSPSKSPQRRRRASLGDLRGMKKSASAALLSKHYVQQTTHNAPSP